MELKTVVRALITEWRETAEDINREMAARPYPLDPYNAGRMETFRDCASQIENAMDRNLCK